MGAPYLWTQFYPAIAQGVLRFAEHQQRLVAILGSYDGFDMANRWRGEREIDPLSVVAALGPIRKEQVPITQNPDPALQKKFKRVLGIDAELPDHYRGCTPLQCGPRWFQRKAAFRDVRDAQNLWRIAHVAVLMGERQLESGLIDACLQIEDVTIFGLSVILFWMNPAEFLPVTTQLLMYLKGRGHQLPPPSSCSSVGTWYKQVMQVVTEQSGDDFVGLVERAEHPEQPDSHAPRVTPARRTRNPSIVRRSGPRRYFAGSFRWEDESKLDVFLKNLCWQIGYEEDTMDPAGLRSWKCFREICSGDWFAIKGLSATNDVAIQLVGEVAEIDRCRGWLKLRQLAVPCYTGPPLPTGTDGGSWFHSILELKHPACLSQIFAMDQDSRLNEPNYSVEIVEPCWVESVQDVAARALVPVEK